MFHDLPALDAEDIYVGMATVFGVRWIVQAVAMNHHQILFRNRAFSYAFQCPVFHKLCETIDEGIPPVFPIRVVLNVGRWRDVLQRSLGRHALSEGKVIEVHNDFLVYGSVRRLCKRGCGHSNGKKSQTKEFHGESKRVMKESILDQCFEI